MIQPHYIRRFEVGGTIDTGAMLDDVKKDPRFFKDGNYTKSGRLRLAAIQEISDNQKSGNKYTFNESGTEFELSKPNSVEGHGVEVGKRAGLLYGLIDKEKRSKKEVSKALYDVGQGKYTAKADANIPDPKKEVRKQIQNYQDVLKYKNAGYDTPEAIEKISDGQINKEDAMFHLEAINKASNTTTKNNTTNTSTSAPAKTNTTNVVNAEPVTSTKKEEVTDIKQKELDKVKNREAKSIPNNTKSNGETTGGYQYGTGVVYSEKKIQDYLKQTEPSTIINNILKDIQYESNTPSYTKNGSVIKGFPTANEIEEKFLSQLNNSTYQALSNELNTNPGKFHQDWIMKNKTLLDKRLNDINIMTKKIEDIKAKGINKQTLQEFKKLFSPIPKAEDGMKFVLRAQRGAVIKAQFGVKNLAEIDKSWEALQRLKASKSKYGSWDEIDEQDLDEQDKLEWAKEKQSIYDEATAEDNVVIPSNDKPNAALEYKKGQQAIGNDYDTPVVEGLKKDKIIANRTRTWETPVQLEEEKENGPEQTIAEKRRHFVWEKSGKTAGVNNDKTGQGLLSPVGLNALLGAGFQYAIARNAYKKKLANVPVNLLKYTPTGHRNVMAPRDIDYAMLKKSQENINQVRSGYKGSDPVLDAIMNQSTQGIKAGMKADLIGKRADYRRVEEDRAYNETEQARQQAAQDITNMTNTYNTNNDRIREGDLAAAQAEKERRSNYLQNISHIGADLFSNIGNNLANKQTLKYESIAASKQADIDTAQQAYLSANEAYQEARLKKKYSDPNLDLSAYETAVKEAQINYNNAKKGIGAFVEGQLPKLM